jgi:hypothetical protein
VHQLFCRFAVARHVVFLGSFIDALNWLVRERKFFWESNKSDKIMAGLMGPEIFWQNLAIWTKSIRPRPRNAYFGWNFRDVRLIIYYRVVFGNLIFHVELFQYVRSPRLGALGLSYLFVVGVLEFPNRYF